MMRNRIAFTVVWLLSGLLVAQNPTQGAAPPNSTASAVPSQSAHSRAADHILQDGTPVKLRLTQNLSSADAKAGQEIFLEVADDIELDGVIVLRRGSPAIGVVTEAEAKRRMGRAGKLSFNITDVLLADDEKAPLRAVNDSSGDSHVKGMTGMMASGVPMAAAPFLLLMHGENTSFPKGTEITAFIDGDMHLNLANFEPAPQPAAQASLVIDSIPTGAEVELDGAPMGHTPLTVAIAPGSHQIAVKKKGFSDWSKTLQVTGGAVHVNAELEQPQAQ